MIDEKMQVLPMGSELVLEKLSPLEGDLLTSEHMSYSFVKVISCAVVKMSKKNHSLIRLDRPEHVQKRKNDPLAPMQNVLPLYPCALSPNGVVDGPRRFLTAIPLQLIRYLNK